MKDLEQWAVKALHLMVGCLHCYQLSKSHQGLPMKILAQALTQEMSGQAGR